VRKSRKRLLLEILAIVLFLAYMIPFFIILINAAKPTMEIIVDPLSLPDNPTQLIENVEDVLTSDTVRYVSSFVSSVIITVVSVGLLVLISSMAAWVLVRTKTKLSNAIFMVFVAAIIIPFQVVMFPLISWFFNIEQTLGINNTPFQLLGNYPGIIFAYLGFGSSLSIFLYHGFIKGIPLELEEAAIIDGCTRIQVIFRVIMPVIVPGMVTVLAFAFINCWNEYLLSFTLYTNSYKFPLSVGLHYMIGEFNIDFGALAAGTIIALIPPLALFGYVQRYLVHGLSSGAVKG